MAKRSKSPRSAPSSAAVRIPIAVGNLPAQCPAVPVWMGVPLPKSAVTDAAALRLLDATGRAVPGQFDVEARWSDGSVKWVLASFFASGQQTRFTLTNDAPGDPPAPPNPVKVRVDTNSWLVSTGAMQFLINQRGFGGVTQGLLDIDRDGALISEDLIAPETDRSGIVAVDCEGVEYRSRFGRTGGIELERSGPLHATVALRGDLRTQRGDCSLLNYAVRIHAFAGSSLLRVVLTVQNPRASGRSEDGARWTLGQSGAVLLKSLEFVLPVRLTGQFRRVTLSPEPGKILDRIPLTGPMGIYQDSSGGENWFHRAHSNRHNVIPLQFRGYRVDYRGRQIDSGLRASPWLEVSDMRWAAGVAAPVFWQNFPKSLAVDGDGTIRLGLWPGQAGDAHELQGGEQKTCEFWLYFRHRRGERFDGPRDARPRTRTADLMPLASEVFPVCLNRPTAWASAETYLGAGVFQPFAPRRPGKFQKYEAIVAAAVKAKENLFVHREMADEYGWRHFGDTPAFNEHDQTQGPYHGLRAHSHYNNEYDLGLGMLTQALRNVDADYELAKAWWDLGVQALWHEADIDIYHTREDGAPIYNGGTFTHTAHGVDAAKSTHRGAPQDENWGRLDWSWQKGSTPEAGHLRNQGIVHAYLLTGDRHLLDAAMEVSELAAWKIRAGRFAQIDVPDRSGGNNLQLLLEAYLLSWDAKWLACCETLIDNLSWQAVAARVGEEKMEEFTWSTALYVKSLGRFIEVMAETGRRHEKAIAAHLAYSRASLRGYRKQGWHTGTWSLLMCEVMMQAAELTDDPPERKAFIAAAKAAFQVMDKHVRPDGSAAFWNSKATTMLLQGGGRYMLHVDTASGKRRKG